MDGDPRALGTAKFVAAVFQGMVEAGILPASIVQRVSDEYAGFAERATGELERKSCIFASEMAHLILGSAPPKAD